jgi:antitoxin MazE
MLVRRAYDWGMQTALRKMGNSTGMILPKPILKLLGVESGASMDLVVEGGRVIATPVRNGARHGWEADAERIGSEPLDDDSASWLAFGNDHDEQLEW